jgi:preprotein translocase subunit SecE
MKMEIIKIQNKKQNVAMEEKIKVRKFFSKFWEIMQMVYFPKNKVLKT